MYRVNVPKTAKQGRLLFLAELKFLPGSEEIYFLPVVTARFCNCFYCVAFQFRGYSRISEIELSAETFYKLI